MTKAISYFTIIMVFTSCKSCKEPAPESLCSYDVFYDNENLRLDGYYYRLLGDAEGTREIFFFYRNGTMLYGGIPAASQLANEEIRYSNGDYYNSVKSNVNYWGRFSVSGGWFSYEHWYPSSTEWKVYVRDGEILDDTTMQVTKSYRCDGSEQANESQYLHFKHLSLKPDSTNQFVE